MAEAHNVQVDEEWFREPDEDAKEAIAEMLRDGTGGSGRTSRRQPQRARQPERAQQRNAARGAARRLDGLRPEELQRLRDEHMDRLRKLVDLGAPSKVISKERNCFGKLNEHCASE